MTQNLVVSSVFFAGLLSFFSPCILPLLPVYFGILTDRASQNETRSNQPSSKNLLPTLLFIFGLGTSFILLGFGAGAISALISHPAFMVIGGLLMIFFGLIQLGLVPISFFTPQIGTDFVTSDSPRNLRAYVLGVLLSLGWTPCIGPVFASVLVLAAQGGTALQGAVFMAIYTLGLAIPFLMIALFADTLLQKIKRLNRWTALFKKIGGVFLIIIGLLLMTNRLMF